MPDATPAAAAKASTTSTVVSAFRRMMELMLMLAAALAALFFYKSAEETEKERERLEKARVVSALARFALDGSILCVNCKLMCIYIFTKVVIDTEIMFGELIPSQNYGSKTKYFVCKLR